MKLYCRVVGIFDQKIMDDFVEEHKKNNINFLAGDCSLILGKSYLQYESFYHWYKEVRNLDLENNLKKKQVGCTCFLVFRKSDDKLIGIFDVRHNLNFPDGNIFGHIGVDIRPTERGKGYYKNILQLAIIEAKNLSIDSIVISCEYDNIASKKGIDDVFGEYKQMVLFNGTYLYVYEKEVCDL